MQYKIIHRIIGTNSLLYKMGKIPYMTCDFCNMYIETIEHLFFDCINVKNFWLHLFDDVNVYMNSDIQITGSHILLMYKSHEQSVEEIVNKICLYGKRYIFICKLRKVNPSKFDFYRFMLEEMTHIKEMKNVEQRNFYNSILTMKEFY